MQIFPNKWAGHDWRKSVEYIYARELKKYFSVYGSFYDLELESKTTIHCRNVLEIYRNTYPTLQSYKGKQYCHKPDALFIMMNPGSSKPTQDDCHIDTLSCTNLSEQILEQCLVPAKPDVTQYQVMRVMMFKQWQHVRVINLSDIREPKSSDFVKQVKNLNNPIHSIFSPDRQNELQKALDLPQRAPIICAWGTNKGLSDLANLCFKSIPDRKIAGIPAGDCFYYHPLPSLVSKQKEWLSKIMDCLQES